MRQKEMFMNGYRLTAVMFISAALCGCKSTYNVKRVTPENISREGSIVWVRPKRNLPLQSLRRRMEIMYEKADQNQAGLLEVRLGCRNKSGSDLVIYLKTAFYDEPFSAPGVETSAPIYLSNWQRVTLPRGATEHYKVTCPKSSGKYYQVSISEDLQ